MGVIYDCDSEVHFQSLQASTNGFGKGDFNARSSAVVRNSTAAELVASFLTQDIVDCVATNRYFDFRLPNNRHIVFSEFPRGQGLLTDVFKSSDASVYCAEIRSILILITFI